MDPKRGSTGNNELSLEDTNTVGDVVFSYPEIDMSTALWLLNELTYQNEEAIAKQVDEKQILSPGPLTFAPTNPIVDEKSHLSKEIVDELITLYFIHVHPLLPVVDEYEFTQAHKECSKEEETSRRHDPMLFLAMLFLAFAHLEESKLNSTPYRSIPEAQKSMMERVKMMYSIRSTVDPIILTQVCLLLSFWSPYNSDIEVNSHWVDRAFHHAKTARIWDPESDSGALHSRNKIIWWCCLIRDRQISFALRRLHRLREDEGGWPLVTELDFGPEALFPSYMSVTYKKARITAFIWLCKLSNLIAEVAAFQHRHSKFGRDVSVQVKDTPSLMEEVNRASELESELHLWKKGFTKATQRALEEEASSTMSKVPLLILPFLHASLLTSLYRPFLNVESHETLNPSLKQMALRKVKESSPKVIKRFLYMTSQSQIHEMPLAVLAWLNYPYAVCQLGHRFDSEDLYLPTLGQMHQVGSFFERFGSRHSGAFAWSTMMQAVARLISQRILPSDKRAMKRRRIDSASTPRSVDANPSKPKTDEEARLLDMIGSFIDLSLAGNDNIAADKINDYVGF